MSPDEARALFLNHCQPGDRGTLERHGEKAAVAAITAATAHIEAEARRYAGLHQLGTDSRTSLVIFADVVSNLTAERIGAPSQNIETGRG